MPSAATRSDGVMRSTSGDPLERARTCRRPREARSAPHAAQRRPVGELHCAVLPEEKVNDVEPQAPLGLVPLGPPREVPRPEHPRPLLVRPRGFNLNGTWELAFDDAHRGLRDGGGGGRPLPGRVVVPYPIESALSGVAEKGPRPVLWYRRRFEAPPEA